MSCSKCNEKNINPCGCNKEPELCGCKSKVDLLCTYYSGVFLDPLNIQPGTDGNTIIKIINDFIKNLLLDLEVDPVVIENVGNGFEVYKGLKDGFRHQIKTILEGNGINITEQEDTITISVDSDWNNISIESLGNGLPLVVKNGNNNYSIKSLKSNDNSININGDPSGAVDIKVNPDIIAITEIGSDGTGIPIYNGTQNKRTGIASLKSDTLVIRKEVDGTIFIDNTPPNTFQYLKLYYVNTNYVPTPDAQADGSVIRPFPTFEEAFNEAKGSGTIANPENVGSEIVIQTNVSTALNPTIAGVSIRFENFSTLTYTGTDEYMFDSELIYPLAGKDASGVLDKEYVVAVHGNGYIVRTNGYGMVRAFHANRPGTSVPEGSNNLTFKIGKETNSLVFLEQSDQNLFNSGVDLQFTDGTLLQSHFGRIYKGVSSVQPTIPLFHVKYKSQVGSTSTIFAGDIRIVSRTQPLILVEDSILGYENLILQYDEYNVAYDSSRSFLDIGSNIRVYRPFLNRYAVKLNNAFLYGNKVSYGSPGMHSHGGFSHVFQLEGDTNDIFRLGHLEAISGLYADSVIKLNNISKTSIALNNSYSTSNIHTGTIQNFIEGVGQSTVNVAIYDSSVNVKNLFSNITTLNLNTYGKLASVSGNAHLTGLWNYANNADAVSGGLIKGNLYFNTTSNSITVVV